MEARSSFIFISNKIENKEEEEIGRYTNTENKEMWKLGTAHYPSPVQFGNCLDGPGWC